MKKLITVAFALFLIACTKTLQNHPVDPPMENSLSGKWAFNNSIGINIPQDAITNNFIDTLIYNEDYSYIFIDNKDTLDKGIFSTGYAEAVNGFGIKQGYDSILLKSNSLTFDYTYPHVLYMRQTSLDTISFSNYYKDNYLSKAIVSYIRVK